MGVLFVVLSSVLFGIYPSIQSRILTDGVSPSAQVFLSSVFSCFFSLFLCMIRRQSLKITRRQLFDLFLIGGIGLFATDYFLALAYTMLAVGYVTMIHFIYPSLVCIAMVLFFHERMRAGKVYAILLSFAGLSLLSCGSFSGSMSGIGIAVLSAVFYTCCMVSTERSSAADVSPLCRAFYTNLFMMPSNLILVLCCQGLQHRSVHFPHASLDWILCVMVGAFVCAAVLFLNLGIQEIGAVPSSFISMIEPVTSLFLSAMLYHYSISAAALGGCVLILASLVFAALDARAENEKVTRV